MADETVKVEIVGEAATAISAIRQTTSALESGVAQMKGTLASLTSAFSSIQTVLVGLGAAFAGGKLFGDAIEATKQLEEHSINLGKSLGVSASTASVYGVAIESVGGSSEDFGTAISMLTRSVRTHEGALNDMGIKTRDAGGNLRDMNDVFFDAVNVVNSYQAGIDRNAAAQVAFGRGATATSAIFRMTKEDMAEAAVTAEELGLVVGKQQVADFEENRKATAGAHQVWLGLSAAVSEALMPVLTQLAQWFRSIGPAAIAIVRTAMADLVTVFWLLDAVVVEVWNVLLAMVASVIEPLKGLATAVWDALHGNFAKAKEDLKSIAGDVRAAWTTSFDAIGDNAQKVAGKIKAAFTDPTGDAAGAAKGKKFDLAPPDTTDKLIKESSRWAEIEIRNANETLNAMKKVQELKDLAAEEGALGQIAASEKALQEELKDGQVSAAQFLAQENALIDQRLAVQRRYYSQKSALAVGDEVELAKIQTEITKTEADALKQRQQADNTAQQAQLAQWKQLGASIEANFMSSMKGMIEGTKSFSDAVRSLFASLIDGIIGIFVKMAVQWAENMIIQKILGKETAGSQIVANASVAATAAMASVAAIPWVGWAMAPEVAAATEADALGYLAGLSAAGGFDVPSGVNPVTQLHAREMVLPAHLADAVRASAGSSGGAPHVHAHFEVHAMDSQSLADYLDSNGHAIAQTLAKQMARFHPALR